MSTTMAMQTLTDEQQMLIDARLDTIDRMLLGRMSRADRLAIVQEVESQIHDMLGGFHDDSIAREQVIDVLRRLDPPEAYLPEGDEDMSMARPMPRRPPSQPPARPMASSPRREGLIGGILGLVSFGMLLIVPAVIYGIAILFESDVFLIVSLPLATLAGLAGSIFALVLSIRGRKEGIWPLAGMILAPIALFFWGVGFLYACLIVASSL